MKKTYICKTWDGFLNSISKMAFPKCIHYMSVYKQNYFCPISFWSKFSTMFFAFYGGLVKRRWAKWVWTKINKLSREGPQAWNCYCHLVDSQGWDQGPASQWVLEGCVFADKTVLFELYYFLGEWRGLRIRFATFIVYESDWRSFLKKSLIKK